MAETLYFDPVTRQSWWPSRGEKPPHWAEETPEGKEYLRRKRMYDDMMGIYPRHEWIDTGYVHAPYIPK